MSQSQASAHPTPPRWLLLIHQIPPRPAYLRVKTGRRLQRLGAVAIKNSVYALPKSDAAHEDLQWVLREIVNGGGDASLCEANFVDGLTDEDVEALFHAARKADYGEIAAEARQLERALPRRGHAPAKRLRSRIESELARLTKRLGEVKAIDFFGACEGELVAALIAGIADRLRPAPATAPAPTSPPAALHGRTWVTRAGIHVDRMASAWLIRRFIDQAARFKFVPARGHRHQAGELRFDMFEAEFTHEGDLCTFEVLLARFALDDPGLRAIAEIVHDIDLKDGKHGRPDTPGFARVVAGIALAHPEDDVRLERASAVLDDLHQLFRRTATQGTGTKP
jgi:hypothetical protein